MQKGMSGHSFACSVSYVGMFGSIEPIKIHGTSGRPICGTAEMNAQRDVALITYGRLRAVPFDCWRSYHVCHFGYCSSLAMIIQVSSDLITSRTDRQCRQMSLCSVHCMLVGNSRLTPELVRYLRRRKCYLAELTISRVGTAFTVLSIIMPCSRFVLV